MKVRILHTKGDNSFEESFWEKPEPSENDIEVKAVLTGICRSDIEMMLGNFKLLPMSMQGHEGLGQVTKVGSNIANVKVGDYVATRGEPAYADFYNVKQGEYAVVPYADPKYILEPVACGINVIMQPYEQIRRRSGNRSRCLILGSGFLAKIVYNTIKILDINFKDIDVVGNYNKELWGDILSETYQGTYDVVIDLSSRTNILEDIDYSNEALLIFGVQKSITSDFENLLWKACTIVFPSPRFEGFHNSMILAEKWITSNKLIVDKFWTKSYNRDTAWEQAFKDALNRPANYNRGYIKWD
jgi:threonine dehydrogenase-like Zn-dependent dehydrogenase